MSEVVERSPAIPSFRPHRLLAITAALLALLPVGRAQAEVFTLRLQDAGPEEVGRELSRILRTPVEVRGGAGRKVSLTMATALPNTMLDRAAALLGGTWSARLRVTGGQPRGEDAPPSPHLDRVMALGLQDVSAQRAFALVAREVKADLVTTGNLEQRVTVLGVNAPAATLLNRIADQANASWSLAYRIEATEAIAETRPVPTPLPRPETPPLPPPVVPTPMLTPAPSAPSGAAVRAALWDGIKDVIRVPPNQRSAAVSAFLKLGEQLVHSLDSLPLSERQSRLQALRPLLAPWKRLFGGLAPDLQRQLAPVTQFLERLTQ